MPAATRSRAPKAPETVEEAVDQLSNPVTSDGQAMFDEFIDPEAMQMTPEARAAKRNRAVVRPYRQYQKRVIEGADIPGTQQTRQLTSHICGMVARLPFVPDNEIKSDDGKTDLDRQVIRIAQLAEEQVGSEMVWTTAARKLAKEALSLRAQDPDGSKGVAWVNDQREDDASALDE